MIGLSLTPRVDGSTQPEPEGAKPVDTGKGHLRKKGEAKTLATDGAHNP